MKHAFLIMAHHQFEILEVLLSLLDHADNDIYIHFDKKVEIPVIQYQCKDSKLYILENRIDARWGDISLVKLECFLFETALKTGKYDYLHLLSGVDLPIKSMDYIHDFFKKHRGAEFVGFENDECNRNNCNYKTKRYHLFTRYYRNRPMILSKQLPLLRAKAEGIINRILPNRNFKKNFYKGSNWVSITSDFCEYLLSQKKRIIREYKYTFCSDEIFIQTIILDSPFINNLYKGEEESQCSMREVDWKRGNPYVWKTSDLDYLVKSSMLFARKFDINEDKHIVYKVKQLFTQ